MKLDNEKLLSVKNLNVNFATQNGEVQALRDIDIELHASTSMGIVGESGSAKASRV